MLLSLCQLNRTWIRIPVPDLWSLECQQYRLNEFICVLKLFRWSIHWRSASFSQHGSPYWLLLQELNEWPSRHLDCKRIQSTPAKNTETENVIYCLDKLTGTIVQSTKISKDNVTVVFWGDDLSMGFLVRYCCLAVDFLNLNLNYKKSRDFALVIVCSNVCVWIYIHFKVTANVKQWPMYCM